MTTPTTESAPASLGADAAIQDAVDLGRRLADTIGTVVRGKAPTVRQALVALLSGGHLLVEDVPGVGKTLLAKTLARALGGTFHRVQGTPDLLPSELTGVSVFDLASRQWQFRPGPLFAHVVLVDELNRATPRTQSALLEAMEERQVSVDGVTRVLPTPFFLVATQNPYEHAGTFPLVEGQLDRFTLITSIGVPDPVTERELLLGHGGEPALVDVHAITGPEQVAAAIAATRSVFCAPPLADYVVEIVGVTRHHPAIAVGASPRAGLALLHAAQAHAVLDGRAFVIPDDIKALAAPVLGHRLVPRDAGRSAGDGDGAALVAGILAQVPVPRG